MWEGMGWDEKRVRWGDMKCEEIRWFEMRWAVECEVQVWSASVKREVHGVKSAVWSVKKMLRANLVARRSRSREATAQQVRTKHARTAHGAREFYRWKGLVIESKATSAPPPAGTTGISFLFIIWIMINTPSTYSISFMYSLHSLYNNTRVTCSSALSGHPSSPQTRTRGTQQIGILEFWSSKERKLAGHRPRHRERAPTHTHGNATEEC